MLSRKNMFTCLILFLWSVAVQSSVSQNTGCNITFSFHCTDGNGCISREKFCDGVVDCSDGSDEIIFSDLIHGSKNGTSCSSMKDRSEESKNVIIRTCYLPKKYICDHEIDCEFGEDESNCTHTFQCATVPPPFNASFEHQYRIRILFCDNVRHCQDGSDELKYSPGAEGYQCAVTKTRITTKCLLPTVHVCDGISDCDDGTDECRCSEDLKSAYSTGRCFRCLDETLVVPQKKVCDGKFDCPDLTDECLCPSLSRPKLCDQLSQVGQKHDQCEVGEVRCRPENATTTNITCLKRTSICDKHYDCPLLEDEENCNHDASQIFNCSNGGSYIPLYQYCDNYTDCNDGSDEINCQSLYQCLEYHEALLPKRAGAYDFAFPRYAEKCDNLPDCEDFDDECNSTVCPNQARPGYCDYVNGTAGFICPVTLSGLIGKEICDGFPTCNETSPAQSADEFDCDYRFYCDDKGAVSLPIHIPLSAQCDGIPDCYDWSDEMNCSTDTHHYCQSNSPLFIPQRKVCNGFPECSDGMDECQNCAVSPFSSDEFLIQSYVLQVFVWIIGLFAICGNIGVIVHSGLHLFQKHDTLTEIAYNHQILVLNLALADFLLGIYLLGLGIVNSIYNGRYCQVDIEWRASSSCFALGTIAVISTECSIFLLANMATYRLILIIKPFKTRVKPRYIWISIIFAWGVSILLATIPLSDSLNEYFLSAVRYRDNPFLAMVHRKEVENFTTNLWSIQDQNNKVFSNNQPVVNVQELQTWKNMISTISRLNANYTPELFYGYYSAHGVCLSRLFPDPSSDRSWRFSLFIIILNFLLFMWMFGAYIGIYRLSVKRSKQVKKAKKEKGSGLQRKITRIVITNFCCWMPICIMAFISVAGVHLSPDTYAVCAIILLPINTAFNPFLYSDLPELIWKFMMPVRKRFAKTGCGKWCIAKFRSSPKALNSPSHAQSVAATKAVMPAKDTNVTALHVKEQQTNISHSLTSRQDLTTRL